MFRKSENALEYMFIQMLSSCNEFNDWKCFLLLQEHDVASNDGANTSQKWMQCAIKRSFFLHPIMYTLIMSKR